MRRRILFFFILCCSARVFSQAPAWQWAAGSGSTYDESGNSVVTDATGNVYVTGNFSSPAIIFGTYTLTNVNNNDVFLVKYDPLGNVLWARSGGGIYDDIGWGVAADANGNVIITGSFFSPTIVFDTYTLTSAGGGDIFVIKYDQTGNIIWAKNEGGTSNDNGFGIAIDASNNIIITGAFKSTPLISGTSTLTCSGADDLFVIKYNAAGNTIWAESAAGTGNDQGNGVAVDVSGNIFVTGFFYSSSFAIQNYTLTSAGSNDFFVIKYNAAGSALWTKAGGGAFNDFGYAVACDVSGNVIVTGSFNSSTLTAGTNTCANISNFDIFTAKYNSSGNELWLRSHGGSDDDAGFGLTTDAIGNIYITGHFHSPSIQLGSFNLSNTGIGDIYVGRYDPAGNIAWAINEGGVSDEQGTSMAIDGGGNIFVAGYFYSPTLTIGTSTLASQGMSDTYVAKLQSVVTSEPDHITVENDFFIYPNPSDGRFLIGGDLSEIKNIEVLTITGQKIFGSEAPQLFDRSIDLSDQPKGIYFVNLTTKKTGSFASFKHIIH
jgi:hypothetical protein